MERTGGRGGCRLCGACVSRVPGAGGGGGVVEEEEEADEARKKVQV